MTLPTVPNTVTTTPKTAREIIREEYTRCALDPIYFLRKYCYIQNPAQGKVLFDLYPFQEEILKKYMDNKYNIILKSRQLGLTTVSGGYCLWKMLFTSDFQILVISKDKEAAKELVSRIRLMFDELPSWLKVDCIENNKLSLAFRNGSTIKAFAASAEAGRSLALSLLILDECAFIEQIDTIWAAAAPAVTSHGSACILLSTPNGTGNFFHKTWQKAEKGIAADGTILKFIPTKLPWTVHPDHNQQWRDAQVEILGSERLASQECDADFLTSGHTVINAETIKFYNDVFIEDYIESRYQDTIHIWQPPNYTKSYIVSADVSRGDGSDYSTFHVLDVETLEQVAEFQGQLSTIEFAYLLKAVAVEYNNALLVIENNNIGWSTVLHVVDVLKYDNVYYSLKDSAFIDVDSQIMKNYDMRRREDMVPGFSMTQRIRPMIISKLETYMRNHQVIIHSKRLLEEIKTFIWLNYKPQAAVGYHDDLIMAMAIALWVRDTALALRQRGIDLTKAQMGAMKSVTQQYQIGYNSARQLAYNPYVINAGAEQEDISWMLNGNEQDKAKTDSDNVREKYAAWSQAYKNQQK